MNSARKLAANAAANWAGQLLQPVLALMLVPVYLAYFGVEAYGLIGAFAALSLLLNLLTLGIGQALQREFARRAAAAVERGTMRRLAYSFERVFAAVGILAAALLIASAEWIGARWIQAGALSARTIEVCLYLMAARVAIAFPLAVYTAIFVGSERQVEGNVLSASFSLLGAAVSVCMAVFARSLVALYAGEIVVAAGLILAARGRALRALPPASESDPARFSASDVRALARLSAGLIWTSAIGVVIAQIDRILLGRIVGLAELGVYNAGIAGGRLLSMVYSPYLTAAFPRTCRLAAAGDREALTRHVLQNAAVVSALVAAIAMPLCRFAGDLLWVWTRNPAIRDEGAAIMAVYACGSVALANAAVLHMLQTAVGSVRPSVVLNSSALFWYPMLLWRLTETWGSVGAAWAWLIYGAIAWIALAAAAFAARLDRAAAGRYLWRTASPVAVAAVAAIAADLMCRAFGGDHPALRAASAAAAAALSAPFALLLAVGGSETRQLVRALRGRSSN